MRDDEPEIPDPLAAFDQLLRGVVDFARLTRAYYLASLEQGFTEAQAMALTMSYQAALIRGAGSA